MIVVCSGWGGAAGVAGADQVRKPRPTSSARPGHKTRLDVQFVTGTDFKKHARSLLRTSHPLAYCRYNCEGVGTLALGPPSSSSFIHPVSPHDDTTRTRKEHRNINFQISTQCVESLNAEFDERLWPRRAPLLLDPPPEQFQVQDAAGCWLLA